MDKNTRLAFLQARDYLRQGKTDEARLLLVGILKQDPKNERAWYMLAFVFDEPERRRYALEQVLQINPQNKKALQKLQALSSRPEQPVTAPHSAEAAHSDPPAATRQPPQDKSGKQRRRISAGLLALFVIGALFVITIIVSAVLLATGVIALPGLAPVEPNQAAVVPTEISAPPTATFTIAAPTEPAVAGSETTPPLAASATPRVYKPVFEPANCDFKIPEDTTVDCGFVVVPESRASGSFQNIRLAVAVFRGTGEELAPDPVLFLSGGPGSDGISFAPKVYDYFVAPILDGRDFVVFDQRGAGMSQPSLACQELEDLHLRNIGQRVTETELGPQYLEAFQKCHDRLAYMGLDLSAYTTTASAADVKDILAVLGYEQANLFGISYGTRLALAVMRDYPEIVRSVVLDSSLPLEVQAFNDITISTDNALNAMFADCAADPKCSAAFPDLDSVFSTLVDQLSTEPVTVKVIHPINGQPYETSADATGLINAISFGVRVSQLTPDMPQMIYDIRDGDYAYLGALLSETSLFYSDISMGMYTSINCHEQVYATTSEDLAADLAKKPSFEEYGRSAVYGSPENLFSICDTWGAAPFDTLDNQLIFSDIPTLILAGEYDPATPPIYGRQIDINLGNSHYIEFPGQGHSLSTAAITSCPFDIALSFIGNPGGAPDTSCIAEMGAPWFVIPFTPGDKISFDSFSSPQYGIRGIVPEGWTDAGHGFYIRATSLLDPTQVGIQSIRAGSNELLDYISKTFLDFGFDEAAEFTGTYQSKGFTWNLYLAKSLGNRIDLALAERYGQTFMVLFVSKARERDALYQAAFLPIVNSVDLLR